MLENREIMEKHLNDISTILSNEYINTLHIGALEGISGFAIFQFHYARFLNSDKISNSGVDMISYCIEKLNNGYQDASYCRGIAGFCWAVQYLVVNNFVEIDCDELLSPMDSYLYDVMKTNMDSLNYDFLYGSLGYAFYFFNRYNNTNDVTLKEKYKSYITDFILFLEGSSIQNDSIIKWKSKMGVNREMLGYNFGLAHGIPSLINFLSRLQSFNKFDLPIEKLLRKSVNYLTSYQNDDAINNSFFPDLIYDNDSPIYRSRLAWCYGDLGVGLSLFKAGKSLNDSVMMDNAKSILLSTTKRKTKDETLVVDAPICHGSFGIAKIYQSLEKEHGNLEFKKASNFWVNDGLKKSITHDKLAIYKSWNPMSKEWETKHSLLEGSSGIGLVMIEQLNNSITDTWGECLLIN